jgi:hypothetical protein
MNASRPMIGARIVAEGIERYERGFSASANVRDIFKSSDRSMKETV